ncbi:MAG: DTW domain-containing protein [Sulfurovum sp.]|nr:DTW domain-containing protein [Sulfurovum sp.]
MSTNPRAICYSCYRPQTSCMCKYIYPIETKTRFILLMHPKEFRKTKNGTGHFTNLSLKNCEIIVGIDFTHNEKINTVLNDEKNACYVLYPSKKSINLNTQSITKENKKTILFLIDATWPCSRAILRASQKLDALPKVSFIHTKTSMFMFKEQPNSYCLSTIESTLCVLELLNVHKDEELSTKELKNFLAPFKKMVTYQLSYNL